MTDAVTRTREWSSLFRNNPLAVRVVGGLGNRAPEIWRHTFDLLQKESPEYRNSVDDEFTLESQAHCKELLLSIVALARGRTAKTTPDTYAFVRAHAEWRARRQVPLVASLHAYRLAHKTYSAITRELLLQHPQRHEALLALAMLSDFWIEFFDHIGFVLADAHAGHEAQAVAKNTRAYTELIDELLRGIEPAGAEARRLRTLCGIRPGAPMAVAVARPFRSASPNHEDVEPGLRSLVRLLQQELPSAVFGKLVAVRDDEVAAIVCTTANPARSLYKVLRRLGFGRRAPNGVVVAIGVSRDTVRVSQLPEALREARLALEFANAVQPLVHFTDIDVNDFLIRRADETTLRLIPEWASNLTSSEELSRTIRAFAECSLNVKQTAHRLEIHPNTVYFRLNQIKKLTNTDPRTFSGISLLLTVLRILDVHPAERVFAATQR